MPSRALLGARMARSDGDDENRVRWHGGYVTRSGGNGPAPVIVVRRPGVTGACHRIGYLGGNINGRACIIILVHVHSISMFARVSPSLVTFARVSRIVADGPASAAEVGGCASLATIIPMWVVILVWCCCEIVMM